MLNKEGIIVDRRELLRVKVKSLMAEARIIRREEHHIKSQRTNRGGKMAGAFGEQLLDELRLHRATHLRSEARLTHVAYGLVRGRPYERIEARRRVELTGEQWKKIFAMFYKYGPTHDRVMATERFIGALGRNPWGEQAPLLAA